GAAESRCPHGSLVGVGPAGVGDAGAGEVHHRVDVGESGRRDGAAGRVEAALVGSVGLAADEADDLVAVLAQVLGEGSSEESGGTGDGDAHEASLSGPMGPARYLAQGTHLGLTCALL